MDISLKKLREILIFEYYLYLIPISIVLVFTLTFLYRKKSWKECGKAYLWTFIISSCLHYAFYAIVYQLLLDPKWHVLSMGLVKDAVNWSYNNLINLIVLRLIMKGLQRMIPVKFICYVVFTFVACVYLIFLSIYVQYFGDSVIPINKFHFGY